MFLYKERLTTKIFNNLVLHKLVWCLRGMVPSPSPKSNQVRNFSPAYLWSVLTLSCYVYTSMKTYTSTHTSKTCFRKSAEKNDWTRPTQRIWLENSFVRNLVRSGLKWTCTLARCLAVSGEKYAQSWAECLKRQMLECFNGWAAKNLVYVSIPIWTLIFSYQS